jgi:hypothetical protein
MASDESEKMEVGAEAAEDADAAGEEEAVNAVRDDFVEAHIWRAQS